jgi:carboxymethylenebutenolidase
MKNDTPSSAFAVAVQPITAQTVITTDTEGLETGWVSIPTRTGALPAYRSIPAQSGIYPVILVVQEIFGVHEHIRDITRRLAKLGYLAIAPELYFRQGDVSKLDSIETIRPVVATVPDAQVLSDLDATVAWAGNNYGDIERLGITGFCWGGRIVWLYAAHQPLLKAGVAWYGRLAGETGFLTPRNPVDVAGELNAPVLGLYGGEDQGIPVATVERMQLALRDAGSASEILLYPDAPHAFHADYRPSYRREPAEDGWNRLRKWFITQGV